MKTQINSNQWIKAQLEQRNQLVVYDPLNFEIHLEEEEQYVNYLGMTPEYFDQLSQLVNGNITKK